MFNAEDFSDYGRIFVTGIHRSGTRIASKIVSRDIKIPRIDEVLIWDSWVGVDAYRAWLGRVVYHCPLLVTSLAENVIESDLVVWVDRDLHTLTDSQNRLGFEHKDLTNWANISEPKYPLSSNDGINRYKKDVWDSRIYPKLTCKVLRLNYEDLTSSSLWIPKSKREEFNWYETSRNTRTEEWPPALDSVIRSVRR